METTLDKPALKTPLFDVNVQSLGVRCPVSFDIICSDPASPSVWLPPEKKFEPYGITVELIPLTGYLGTTNAALREFAETHKKSVAGHLATAIEIYNMAMSHPHELLKCRLVTALAERVMTIEQATDEERLIIDCGVRSETIRVTLPEKLSLMLVYVVAKEEY